MCTERVHIFLQFAFFSRYYTSEFFFLCRNCHCNGPQCIKPFFFLVDIEFISYFRYHKSHYWEHSILCVCVRTRAHVCVCVCVHVCGCFSWTYQRQQWVAVLQHVRIFDFIKYCQIVLQNDCSKLISFQQIIKVFISSHPCQCLVFSKFIMRAV